MAYKTEVSQSRAANLYTISREQIHKAITICQFRKKITDSIRKDPSFARWKELKSTLDRSQHIGDAICESVKDFNDAERLAAYPRNKGGR